MKPKAWLNALVALRDRKAELKTVRLFSAARESEAAEAAVRVAQRQRLLEETAVQAERESEVRRLRDGLVRAWDLQHGVARQIVVSERIDDLKDREQTAENGLLRSKQAHEKVRSELAAALSNAEAAHGARDRHQAEVLKERQAVEDEAAGEVWLATHVLRRDE